MPEKFILSSLGMVNALGDDLDVVWRRLSAGDGGLVEDDALWPGRRVRVGRVTAALPALPDDLSDYECRNNRLAQSALRGIEPSVHAAVRRFGKDRVGVVAGSSTSGVGETETAFGIWRRTGALPADFRYVKHELGGLAEFVARALKVGGPRYTVSTACSSGAKVFAAGRALIRMGVCDAVVVGGADSLCSLTVRGFGALESLSDDVCQPLSRNRKGLNIGEGAAFFLMERGTAGVSLLGVGESSDAHHMSAPEPEGMGAQAAMEAALRDAACGPADVAYVNLHGTATPHNDRMESLAVHRVLPGVPVSSSKPLTGHALGAAGALEVAFCWMALSRAEGGRAPLIPHLWDGVRDEALPALPVALSGDRTKVGQRLVFLSNSFGFGGNNCAVLLGSS